MSLCTSDSPVTLVAADPSGTWSGTGVVGTTFDPSSVVAGTYTVFYTVVNGSCTDSDTQVVTVLDIADATIAAVGMLCASDAAVTLSAVTSGGTWSGTGVSGASFDPGLAGTGTHTVIYTISGSCGDADTMSVVVDQSADASIIYGGAIACNTDTAFNLTAVDTGGTWTGFGITDPILGTFDPTVAGAGSHTITYTIVGNCGDTDVLTITVTGQQDATINAIPDVCANADTFSLNAADPGGFWSGPGVIDAFNGTFDPQVADTGVHWVYYTIIAGSCGDQDSTSVTVLESADASISASGPYCEIDSVYTLNTMDQGGMWTGSGIVNPNTGTFNPINAGPGTHSIVYVTVAACGDADTVNLVVTGLPTAPTVFSDTFCLDSLSPLIASDTGYVIN